MQSKLLNTNHSKIVTGPVWKKLLLSECDVVADLDLYSCAGSLENTIKLYGASSIKLVKDNTVAGYFLASITRKVDLTKYKNLIFSFYTPNNANLASIGVVLFTSTPFDYGNTYIKYITTIATGWNTFKIPLVPADFIIAGLPTLADVEGIRFIINITVDNATETVYFDKIYLNRR